MGRLAFGRPDTFAEVVRFAHQRGMTISGDLLFNLPGQTLSEMRQDVSRAIDIGLDHLGLYHLVMFRGLGTPWSRDESLLAALPDNQHAAENWLNLRQMLLASGFCQTTLTNFERSELATSTSRFQYEQLSFRPEQFDMLGFGPGGISYTKAAGMPCALKTMNPVSSADYMRAVDSGPTAWDRYFPYQEDDLKVFYLTRWLAALSIDAQQYQRLFARSLAEDFEPEMAALREEELISEDDAAIAPTPRGIFYADSIAALFARRRVQHLRNTHRHRPRRSTGRFQYKRRTRRDRLNDNGGGYM
jgi:oxygen-independent coproporphyrinogen-3 oxidase